MQIPHFLYYSCIFPCFLHLQIDNIIAIILLFDNDLFILKTLIYGIEQQ